MPEQIVQTQSERVEKMRKGLRLPAPKETKDDLDYPANLASLSEDQLARHLTHWSALAGYASYKLAILAGAATIAQMEFEQEFDVRYATSTDHHVTDKRHNVGASKAVRLKKRKACQLQADVKVLEALRSSYELKYQAVSRELTRRKSERSMDNTR